MTAGDRALQAEVIGLFRSQTEGWRNACETGEGWRDAVHTLKGSARGIGLVALAAACVAAETAPEDLRIDALAQVRTALAEALIELDQFASP